MPDVIDQLRAYAEAAEAAVPEVGPGAGRQRRPGRIVLAAAAAVLVVAAVGGVLALRDDDDPLPVTSGIDEPAEPTGGRWDGLPPAPINGRTGHVTVATGDELIVWGGRNDDVLADGAAWSFEEERWRTLAPSPLDARAGALAVWTGAEVVIVGGGHRDAAAYDPVADSWRIVPAPPFDAAVELSDAAWTGSELVVVGIQGRANEFHPSDTYALDPDEGEWRALAPQPDHEGTPRGRRALWTGDELLSVTIADLQPVTIDRLDVAADQWAATVTTDVDGLNMDTNAIVWTGDELVLAGSYEDGAVFEPATGEVRTLPASQSTARYPAQVVDGLVTVGDKVLGSDGSWTDVAEIPVPREFPGTAAHGGRLYVWGGSGCGPGASCAGFVQVPEGMTWSPTAPPAPAAEPGSFELDGGLVCGPTDAIELDLTMTSPASRYVTAELVIAGKLAAGPEVTYVVAGEVERFDSDLMRVVSRAQRSHEEGVLRVRDHASGDVLAEQVVSLRLPPGIQCG